MLSWIMVVGVVNEMGLNIGLQRCHLDHFVAFLDIRLWLDRRSEIWLLVMIWRFCGFIFRFWMVRFRLIRFCMIWFWLVDLSVERFWVIRRFRVVGFWVIGRL